MGQVMSEDKESKRGNGPRDGNPRIHGSAMTRNAVLGRANTPAEDDFVKHGPRFGQ